MPRPRAQDHDRPDDDALARLAACELHAMAKRLMSREPSGHTLQTTALVNEAVVRLLGQESLELSDRNQVLAVASVAMRRLLVDSARRRKLKPRIQPGDELDEASPHTTAGIDLLDLDWALERLATHDPEASRIVELRYFGGRTHEETASILGMSEKTVRRLWSYAKTWLFRELRRGLT